MNLESRFYPPDECKSKIQSSGFVLFSTNCCKCKIFETNPDVGRIKQGAERCLITL